jgi:hypothetical protein
MSMVFNGTGFTINASSSATDVVDYAWDAEVWCPDCVYTALVYGVYTVEVGGAELQLTMGSREAVESLIQRYAEDRGLDPQSTYVPQPIFNSEGAYDNEGRSHTCYRCHQPLIETDEIAD